MDIQQTLFQLSKAAGPAGAETEAAALASSLLSAFAAVREDSNGNILGEIVPEQYERHLLIDAHVDEIGLIVTAVEDGFVRVAPCGGVDRRILPACEVTVLGKRAVPGVFCTTPPHLSSEEDVKKTPEIHEMAVDTGLSEQMAKEIIRPGDRVVFAQAPCALLGGRVTGKSLDNRASVATVLRALDLLQSMPHKTRITVLFSVQEEVGLRGAATGAFASGANEAVALDVSYAYTPDSPRHKCGDMGKGPMIGIAPVLSRRISDTFIQLAKEHDIPHQLEVMGGESGTNADMITAVKTGIPTGLLSVPLKYMHTAVEVIDLADVENTAKLLALYIAKGGIIRA